MFSSSSRNLKILPLVFQRLACVLQTRPCLSLNGPLELSKQHVEVGDGLILRLEAVDADQRETDTFDVDIVDLGVNNVFTAFPASFTMQIIMLFGTIRIQPFGRD